METFHKFLRFTHDSRVVADFRQNRPLRSCRKIVWYCLQKRRAYNNNNSDDRVAQHLDYVQRTWLDSGQHHVAALGVVGIQTASANEQRRRGLARASQQQSQPWSAEHVSAAVPSPRGSRPRKHWCPSAVRCGHLSAAAEKIYTSPQPPVHAVGPVRCGPPLCQLPPHCLLACREAHLNSYLCYVLTAFMYN